MKFLIPTSLAEPELSHRNIGVLPKLQVSRAECPCSSKHDLPSLIGEQA
jgi:hypothetical protein